MFANDSGIDETNSIDSATLTMKKMEYFICDSNGNDQEQLGLEVDFLNSAEEFIREPDSLSMISDYSEMGLQIKQSVKFSDMIMSTYSDLKNPTKSITLTPTNKSDPDLNFRKYNMLNLALEFSRWKDCQTEFSIDDHLSDNDTRLNKTDSNDDTAMDSISPSILSDFSSIDQCIDVADMKSDNYQGINYSTNIKSPLQIHIEHKFNNCFPKDQITPESESSEENNDIYFKTKITRPAWAQSIFHRNTLDRMPQSIKEFTNSISGFDLSKDKYMWMLNVSQLQLVMNSLMTQIEELNESLVLALIIRDELKSEQLNLIVNVESLTINARNLAKYWKYSENSSIHITQNAKNLGTVHKFLSNFLCSPKATTNRFLSFFTQTNASKIPKPEYV